MVERRRNATGRNAIAIIAASVIAGAPATAQEWSIDWWSTDAGGVHVAQGGGWTLSGTAGQADATAHRALSGGEWQVTGGFWSLASTPTDYQFASGFEG